MLQCIVKFLCVLSDFVYEEHVRELCMAKNTVRYKKRKPTTAHFRLNIATIIAMMVLFYLIAHVLVSMSKPVISTYEVTSQQINDKITTTGIALRKEQVVATDKAGYLTYYVADGERVGVNSTVYAVDSSGSLKNELSNDDGEIALSDDDYLDIKNQIIDYKSSYKEADFGALYDFKYALCNNISEITTDSLISKMDDLIEKGMISPSNQIKAQKAGIVSYCYDGLEGLTEEQLSPELFSTTDNNMTETRTTDMYAIGSAAYRLVTEENWKLALELNKDQYERLHDEEYMTVKFLKDDLKVERPVTFYEQNNGYFAVVSFNKYMDRYVDERYLNVEIVLDSLEGLKIPNSSLIKKQLYKIPVEYAVKCDQSASGVGFNAVTGYDDNGHSDAETIQPAICYKDEKKGFFYVSTADIKQGTVLIQNAESKEAGEKGETGSTYTIGETKEFEGVYTINKGYAQFVVINNLYQADDFCIAQANTEFGVKQYDHIVLKSAAIKEGQIIY